MQTIAFLNYLGKQG